MSSHTRQRFPPFQVECRVTFDSAFRPSMSNVESLSSALSALPGGMSLYSSGLLAIPSRISSHTRRRFTLFQIEFRVTLDSAFCCSRSNVVSYSTALYAVPGRISSHTRQRFPLLIVEYRVTLGSAFCRSSSNVESHSTALSAVRG